MTKDKIETEELETYISESGLYGTRQRTENGCQKYKAEIDKFRQSIAEALILGINQIFEPQEK